MCVSSPPEEGRKKKKKEEEEEEEEEQRDSASCEEVARRSRCVRTETDSAVAMAQVMSWRSQSS